MPNRILRDGILRSARIARLGWAEEVFYRRLHSVVDDFGLYYADAGLLRADCYPRQLHKVSDSDIGKWLTVLVEAALVRVYPASDGERYLQVLDFRQQVRAKESKFPQPLPVITADAQPPPIGCLADATQVIANARLDVDVDVDVCERPAPEKPKRQKKAPETPLPEGFSISDRVRKWATAKGYTDLDAYFEIFTGKARAKGYTYVDWDDAFMGCVREDWGKIKINGAPNTSAQNAWERP